MNRQQEVLSYLQTVEQANLEDIYRNVSFSYYCNYKSNLGKLIARMVRNGTVERIKPGVFKALRKTKFTEPDENQITLF